MKYCVCEHSENVHDFLRWAPDKEGCGECEIDSEGEESIWIHPFKLDNLKYIEDLAKERKLI